MLHIWKQQCRSIGGALGKHLHRCIGSGSGGCGRCSSCGRSSRFLVASAAAATHQLRILRRGGLQCASLVIWLSSNAQGSHAFGNNSPCRSRDLAMSNDRLRAGAALGRCKTANATATPAPRATCAQLPSGCAAKMAYSPPSGQARLARRPSKLAASSGLPDSGRTTQLNGWQICLDFDSQ